MYTYVYTCVFVSLDSCRDFNDDESYSKLLEVRWTAGRDGQHAIMQYC